MATMPFEREQLLAHSIRLEYLTVGWNLLEGAVAIGSGLSAASVALVGFGIDSGMESLSGTVLLWRLWAERRGQDAERVEREALRLVGVSFLVLAAYVALDSITTLLLRERPYQSITGITLAALSLAVMPLLARAKRRSAGRIHSPALYADSRQTSLCAYLSAILLGGLVLNAILGWWWADPVAALIMVPIITSEGLEAMRGKACGNCC